MTIDLDSAVAFAKSLNAAHLTFTTVALAAGAFFRPQLESAARALPNWLFKRVKARFDADVAAGKIPPAAARLAAKVKRAVFEWADEEMPAAVGPEKMAQALSALEHLPYIGKLVLIDPDGVKADLQAEYDALRAEVKREAEADKALPPPEKTAPTP